MMKTIKRVVSVLLIALMFVSVVAPQTFASSKTKKMTTYKTIVSGKYAFCTCNKGIYRVNLNTGKKKLIAKSLRPEAGLNLANLKLYNGRIYYFGTYEIATDEEDNWTLYSIKTDGKSKRKLVDAWDYAISDGKIYYSEMKTYDPFEVKHKVMKLNGKDKKKSSYKVEMKYKKTNKKGYYVQNHLDKFYYEDEDYEITVSEYTDYLIRPTGKKIKLCSYTLRVYDDSN